MLVAVAAVLLVGVSGQQKINNATFDSYFKQLERKDAYLESPPSSGSERPQYLGKITSSKYDEDSLANTFGKFGSSHAEFSIWNTYGKFGGNFAQRSPWNKYSKKAVEILYRQGDKTYIAGYLTANEYYTGDVGVSKVDPKYLAQWLDRNKDIPR